MGAIAMKKILVIVLMFACLTAFAGCNRYISSKDVYGFPEPTQQIDIRKASAGQETEYTIGSENYDSENLSVMPILEWFYGLELTESERPEDVEGNESYTFIVGGKPVFSYDYRGKDEAYIIVSDKWYKVKNPSVPPIE